ncbi:MAG: sigma-70 family RNA polymerase sigma factor [Myxococcota bacterium]
MGSTSLVELMTTPATRIARGQDRMRLLAAMRTLPLDQQLLLELHYWEELDSPALAEVFDIAPPTARSRLHRARAALRERLDRAPDLPDLSESSVADFDQWARLLRDRAEIESC